MRLPLPWFVFAFGTFLILGALSNKLSRKFNLPVVLMFLGIGLVYGLGNEKTLVNGDWKEFISYFGNIAMCFILYSGGFGTKFSSIRRVLLPGGVLAVFGVLITAVVIGGIIHLLCVWFQNRANFAESLLLGALISSTDASAVFSILRGKGVGLKGDLAPLLEFESGSNDPMAAILTVAVLGFIKNGGSVSWLIVPQIFYALIFGAAIGAAIGFAGQYLFRLKLEYDGLYFVFGIGLVMLSYSIADLLKANGFMAVYVCGVVMGNMRYYLQRGLNQFSDGVSWLMQMALFMMLGYLVNTNDLISRETVIGGLLTATAMMFLARPIAVFLCLCRSRFSLREKVMISWVGLRGAAPIVLATYPFSVFEKNAVSASYFNTVFFTVITSVLAQGLTLMPLARLLKLDAPLDDRDRAPLELEITRDDGQEQYEMYEFPIAGKNPLEGKQVKDAALPEGARILLIRRGNHFLSPTGSSMLKPGDGLFILGKIALMKQIAEKFFPGSDYHQLKNSKEVRRSVRTILRKLFERLAAFFR